MVSFTDVGPVWCTCIDSVLPLLVANVAYIETAWDGRFT